MLGMLNSAKSTPFALAADLVPLPVQHLALCFAADPADPHVSTGRWRTRASSTAWQGLVSPPFFGAHQTVNFF
jgi:hypothetical protein